MEQSASSAKRLLCIDIRSDLGLMGGSSCHEDVLHIDWCNREILHSTTIRTLVKPGHGTGKLLRKSDEVRRSGTNLAVCLEATPSRRHVQSLLRSTFNKCKPLEFHPLPPTTRALYQTVPSI